MFGLRRIYIGYLQLRRALQIIVVLIKHGMRSWVNSSYFLRKFKRRKTETQRQVYSTPERIRITIEELGPTYIKFGQILADRPDVITERFRNELKKLQSGAQPFDNDVAISMIRKELGLEIDEIFSEFDYKCLASASIGQVYKARLKTGEKVVVKIQRPNIENRIKLDLYLMRYLAKRAIKSYPDLAVLNVDGLVDEFGQSILKELDYYNEASNMLRFNEMFKGDERIHIPVVHLEYTTKRVLVMEFIDGITPDSPEDLRNNGLDPHIIAQNGADIILKMVLEHGFFHADPHPGNIFIMKNNVISFIDFGMVATLKPAHLNFLASFALSAYRNDPKALAKALVAVADIKFFKEIDNLEFELDQMLKSYSYLPFDKLDFSKIIQECINLMIKYKLQIPSSIYMLAKTLATIQKFAGDLNPDLNLGPIVLPYARKLLIKRFDPRKVVSSVYDTITQYVQLIGELPEQINEVLYNMKQGKLSIEMNINEQESFGKVVRHFGQRISIAILLTCLVVISTALIIFRPDFIMGQYAFGITISLLSILLIKYIFSFK